MMLQSLNLRRFSTGVSSVGKTLLATLRKRTGFPIMKCKEALTRNQNNPSAAEKWLLSQAQKEGWTKVESLRGRSTKQGLIGVVVQDCKAAMVEVNCETDFVARNQKFQSMVSSVAMNVYNQKIPPTTDFPGCDYFTKDDFHATRVYESESQSDAETVADMIARSIGDFSENIVASRGCTFRARDGLICSFAYNNVGLENSAVALGSYGAFVHLLPIEGGAFNSQAGDSQVKFGNQLCQHIIGMNPLAVEPENGIPESDALVNQGFIFDESATVGDLLRRNGLQITNFVRYGLGESTTL